MHFQLVEMKDMDNLIDNNPQDPNNWNNRGGIDDDEVTQLVHPAPRHLYLCDCFSKQQRISDCFESAPRHTNHRGVVQTLLQGATVLGLLYLYVGELLHDTLLRQFLAENWGDQVPVLLATLVFFLALLALVGGRLFAYRLSTLHGLLAALNVLPLLASLLPSPTSDNCPYLPYEGAPANTSVPCDDYSLSFDRLGLTSARLARFDLALCLFLATRGLHGLLFRASGGWFGLPEGVPMHRAVGWWCLVQSMVHSIAYLIFYPLSGGWTSLWLNCFPVALDSGVLNRMGLVNFFGVVAFLATLLLALPALPCLRSTMYHLFQWSHLSLSFLFLFCSALHDLPILLFAVPGLCDWYLGHRVSSTTRTATATRLPGTCWIQLQIDWPSLNGLHTAERGLWAMVRVLPLGRESHPLSVAVEGGRMSTVVTTRNGDWSKRLGTLKKTTFKVEVDGPYPNGGGEWSLWRGEERMLLVAGGTGVFGWLPLLRKARNKRLVWCVKTYADYMSLARKLPSKNVTVFVTGQTSLPEHSREERIEACSEELGEAFSEEQGGERGEESGSRRQAWLWVVLAATVVGLVQCAWVWPLVRTSMLTKPDTFVGFTFVWRLLPIVVVVVSVWGSIWLGAQVAVQRKSGTTDELDKALLVESNRESNNKESKVEEVVVHDVRTGRPDLDRLIREGSGGRLVVAACGPSGLVQAVRDAVGRVGKSGASVHFSGSESKW